MRTFEEKELMPMMCDQKDVMWFDWLTTMCDELEAQYGTCAQWIALDGNVFAVEQSNASNTIKFRLLLEDKGRYCTLQDAYKMLEEYCTRHNDELGDNYCYQTFEVVEDGCRTSFYKVMDTHHEVQ